MTVTRGHKNEAVTNRNPGGLTRENHRSILRPNDPQAHAVAPLLCAGIMIRMDEIEAAYERMLKGDVKYRFVIDLATMKSAT